MTPALRVSDLSAAGFRDRLTGPGLGVRIGPLNLRLRVRVAGLYEPLQRLYARYRLVPDDAVYSVHALMHDVPRRLPWRPRMVRFLVDGVQPHEDMPAGQALAILEWGINLVLAMRFQRFLMLHAAVLERHGRALLMPAAPGSGKTTLCAALAHRGWRFFSDEFGLLRPGSVALLPLPRPMPLKNESIAVMRAFAPEAVLGPEIPGTRKGTVAHVQPPFASVEQSEITAQPRWIVLPRWVAGSPLRIEEVSGGDPFMHLAINAFNYEKLGEQAFDTVRAVIAQSRCFQLEYSDLEEAVVVLSHLADTDAG